MTPGLGTPTTARPELAERLAVSAAVRHPRDRGPDALEWLRERRRRGSFRVTPVPFARLDGWSFRDDDGDLVHRSGRFFSVEGVEVSGDLRGTPGWRQPIIRQDDVAILGILATEIEGVLHFLMQAKMEPGNIGLVQLSPTVQSTPSNYSRAHRGAASRYVEYFVEPGAGRTLVDELQSEQGSWFRGKRNRNVVVEVDEPVEVHDDHRWLTLGQILDLLRYPDVVNMDTRTVLSCLPAAVTADDVPAGPRGTALARSFGVGGHAPRHGAAAVGAWLERNRVERAPVVERIPLTATAAGGWARDDSALAHVSGRYFRIIGVDVQADSREVAAWSQPLLAPADIGLVAFVVRPIGGTLHLLAQADVRAGYRDGVEIGPTVQCTPSNFGPGGPGRPAFLDRVLAATPDRVLHDSRQSEEGGRFHHATTRHLIVEQDPAEPPDEPPGHMWITAHQLGAAMTTTCRVNIEARSLLLTLLATLRSGRTAGDGDTP